LEKGSPGVDGGLSPSRRHPRSDGLALAHGVCGPDAGCDGRAGRIETHGRRYVGGHVDENACRDEGA
jgi:hypothetical protein